MPENTTTGSPPPASSTTAVAPKQASTDATKPKYTPEQQAKAEEKVLQNAADANKKVDEFVTKFGDDLVKFLEKEDANTRTSVIDRIRDRVLSIKTVAANARKLASRSAVMTEEKKSMPRVVTTESRNILAQAEQNKTAVGSGGGDKK